MISRVFGSISRPYRSRIGIVIWFPHVGHVPSCPPIDSVASSRLEQYPQLNPYRFPPIRGGAIVRDITAPPTAPLADPTELCPAPTDSVTGTRTVVRHTGQRTTCPACSGAADIGVRQTWHANTIMLPQNPKRPRRNFKPIAGGKPETRNQNSESNPNDRMTNKSGTHSDFVIRI